MASDLPTAQLVFFAVVLLRPVSSISRMQHEPDVLVHQLGMAADTTDDVLTAFIVVDQHSSIGTSAHAGNSRTVHPEQLVARHVEERHPKHSQLP